MSRICRSPASDTKFSSIQQPAQQEVRSDTPSLTQVHLDSSGMRALLLGRHSLSLLHDEAQSYWLLRSPRQGCHDVMWQDSAVSGLAEMCHQGIALFSMLAHSEPKRQSREAFAARIIAGPAGLRSVKARCERGAPCALPVSASCCAGPRSRAVHRRRPAGPPAGGRRQHCCAGASSCLLLGS